MKYRKKPVVIEAFQWLVDWPPAWVFDIGANFTEEGMVIPTLEGDVLARPGDYIIKGIKGEFYPYKPDVFVATYEPVEPGVAINLLDNYIGEQPVAYGAPFDEPGGEGE